MITLQANTLLDRKIELKGELIVECDIFYNNETVPLAVIRTQDSRYHVVVNNVVRHPNCAECDAIRAFAVYLHGLSYQLSKFAKND
jgi:hypothetical protein